MATGSERGTTESESHGLPEGVELQRVSDEFTATTVPAGLLRAHRLAPGVWGVLRVRKGTVRFVAEAANGHVVELRAGDHHVIEPEALHHVEPDDDACFVIEFHR
jgi:tellurite resistance-related uncharacterized protein